MFKKLPWGAALCIAAVVLVSGFISFYRLGAVPFQDYDEATYAEVVQEAYQHNDFIGLHFLGVDYFRKPSFLFWLMEGSREVGTIVAPGNVEAADRFPAAFAGFATVIVVMLIVYAVIGNGYAAAFGGGVLLATSAFMEPTRSVRFDTLASLFNMLAFYAFIRAQQKSWWLIWMGAFLGLAIFAKGPLVIYSIIAILSASVLSRDWTWIRTRELALGMLALVGILLPWHAYETWRYGTAFWREYVGVQVINRVAAPLFQVSTNNSSYFAYINAFAAPWSGLVLVLVGIFTFRSKFYSTHIKPWFVASFVGGLSVLIVCLLTQTKAISYLIPLYPFLAVAVALGVYSLWKQLSGKRYKVLVIVAAIACLLYGTSLSLYNSFHLNPMYATQILTAQEEHKIGAYLRDVKATTFYVFNTTTLGSIMYYSGIVQPPWLYDGEVPTPGIYVLYQTAEQDKLQSAYPKTHFSPVFSGSVLSLARVVPS